MPLDARLEELLRRLALNDDATVEAALGMPVSDLGGGLLDAKICALVQLAALIALQSSSPSSFGWSVEAAFASGATEAEIVGVIVAAAPMVGVARVNRAAAEIATAVGYDLDLPHWQ
jgi:alkylhydroperoxidase/carboxymuconolactone decarboxylase family protein YurZ